MNSPARTSTSIDRNRFVNQAIPSPKPGLVEVQVSEEIVVYDPKADLLHHLDHTASRVWFLLDGNIALHALAERLAANGAAAETTVRRDILDLVVTLWERGLLSGSGPNMTASERQPVGPEFVSGPLSVPLSELDLRHRTLPRTPYKTRCRRALEHEFEVASNDIAVRDYLEHILIDLAPSVVAKPERYELLDLGSGTDQQCYVVLYNGAPITATSWLDRAFAVLLWHINAEVVRRSTSRYPLLHAAAAVTRGVAVLLPAPAESGKTTTVAGLVRAGFGYLTDEAVAIDPDTMLAQPYPKPLSVDRGSWEVLADLRPPDHERVTGQWQLPPRLIRPDAVAGPAPVRFVIAPAYSADAATRLEPISPGKMLVSLADSTFQFQEHAHRNLTVLADVVTRADCYRLPFNNLDQAVFLIQDLVRSEQLDVA